MTTKPGQDRPFSFLGLFPWRLPTGDLGRPNGAFFCEPDTTLGGVEPPRPFTWTSTRKDLHAVGRHRQPTASRAGAGKSSQALYQPCTDPGVTAPDESAMARTENPQPQLTQRVARMGWGGIGWLMVGRTEGGDHNENQNPFSGVGLTPQMRQPDSLQTSRARQR